MNLDSGDSELRDEYFKMGALRHPNLPAVYQMVFVADGCPCIVMDFYSGGDLHKKIENQGSTKFSQLFQAQIHAGVSSAICHLHEKNFIHRDIKMLNILLDHGMRPILADLGVTTKHTSGNKMTFGPVGTWGFMAPEMVGVYFLHIQSIC